MTCEFQEETFDETWNFFTKEEKLRRKREYRRNHTTDYRKFNWNVPTRGKPFAIVPEISPILKELAAQCGREAGFVEQDGVKGITVLAARAAVVMKKDPSGVHRRLYAIINNKQLFVSADFVECCLMALDAEHDYRYGEWPSRRKAALERVAIEVEMNGKKMSPGKQLAKANRLYEKGVRKALKRAVEVHGQLIESEVSHGKRATYTNKGCRCVKCTKANTDYWRKYKKERVA